MANHVPGIGLCMLAAQCYALGGTKLPIVTFTTILILTFLYLRIIPVTYTPLEVCLSVYNMNTKRFLLSQLEHGNDLHLYFNMASFLAKGISLERRYGAIKFAILILAFIPFVNAFYIFLSATAAHIFNNPFLMKQCAIGFSGVVFALKVITTYYAPDEHTIVFGLEIPNRYAVWFELVLVQLVYPRVSLVGHLAGVLVGLLFMYGPLHMIL